jgi:hypothetical protein
MTAGLAEPYAQYAYVTRPGSLPAPLAADWVVGWIWDPTIALTFVFPLPLFPTGRTLSPRFRPLAWPETACASRVRSPSHPQRAGPDLSSRSLGGPPAPGRRGEDR